MPRRFNTSGPCDPRRNYMLPPERRLPTVRKLIDDELYFVVHAPRQVGKTTSLTSLAAMLTAEGKYTALLVTCEAGQPFSHDVGAVEEILLSSWQREANLYLPPELRFAAPPPAPVGQRIEAALSAWASASPRPLVLFLDEIDALHNEALVAVLRQIRSGFRSRPSGFPSSVALIGLRDVRDYKVASGGSDRLGTSSPFNIKAESLTVRNFNRDEVAELYSQHTTETGQTFLMDAVDRAFYWTQGQPWLVNALARQLVENLVPDPKQAITAADVDVAKEILIVRQDTHLDSLAERLREPRVRQIVEPMLAGMALGDVPADDIRFIQDLGLARLSKNGGLEMANPIYREVIPRCLAGTPQASLPAIQPTWLTPDGRLDPERLLSAFLDFWRQHGEPLLGSAPYHEVAPHLVLMAFLHRVANGGGSVEREYAIGRGRMDLLLRYGTDQLAIEIKVWRAARDPDPVTEGLAQLDGYLEGLSLATGWLVIFDRRPDQPRIGARTHAEIATTPAGRTVTVIRA